MRVLFVEPPKDFWFVMGEYLPPPLGVLVLAAYLEKNVRGVDIQVVDCQAEDIGWQGLEKRIDSFRPDIIAPSSLATCNVYTVLRTLQTAKAVDPGIRTVVGGQHFTALAQESLRDYPEIDFVVRGEGEETLADLVRTLDNHKSLGNVRGMSFRHDGEILHTPSRPLVCDVNSLPLPGYHFVRDNMRKYHFTMMTGPGTKYALIEGSRGCPHRCTFCSQWRHWSGAWRIKSPQRIADEMERCHAEYGSSFFWLTDDNFDLGTRAVALCAELKRRELADEILWFVQARCDDVASRGEVLREMRRAGNLWMLMGVERHDQPTLESFRKGTKVTNAKTAIDLLKKNDIFAQATFIIGERGDSHESIEKLRKFVEDIDPDLAIFMILTPFPGTEVYEAAKQNGWIEDTNWSHYDMVHSIMPTEHLTRQEVQEELYETYRSYYGNMKRRIFGILSPNMIRRRTYTYLASQGLLEALGKLA